MNEQDKDTPLAQADSWADDRVAPAPSWADTVVAPPAGDPPLASPAPAGAADPESSGAAAPEAADPWSTGPAPSDAADPWSGTADAAGQDWLGTAADAAATPVVEPGFQLQQLWDGSLPVEAWINDGLQWLVGHFRPAFQSVRQPIDATLAGVEGLLQSAPMLALTCVLGLLAWQFVGGAVAVGAVVSLLLLGMLGIWQEAMVTLSLVLTSLVFCLLVGLPMGILLAASDRAQRLLRPLLDAMQTTPAFVYLVPVVMLFGIGNVPGVIVTIVFALPPLVRLTALGIRQVRPDLIEAARAYGASPWQLLVKVQLPLAMPSIMAGINQALMLSLSMVVIASMIAVGGLGQMVLRGIGRLDMGLATVGGLGIVLLAITLDRLTQALGTPRRGTRRWWQAGPAGLLLRLVARPRPPATTPSASPAPAVEAN
ncbi:glycine betaine/L-proline ABC transporter permease ProW [Ramlibacter sp.]|uniref:glycine betaine/L-proline ABC transporter permease ProW n=1 Tax=Ramlibacter sp. TaxID=1917967 RepID=UPI002D3AFECB|nr:glycine betaine/L-proline ABC transporter permease ProW [Ramlibacter sp.]HYD76046.1 glycine betaine/L-proline ABC transporter permease ProW [Ramlibacter sp.]